MAIAHEFINLIIRIDAIEAKYQGGWEQFKQDHQMQIGSVAWYDDHLFRIGAMSPADLEPWVEDYRAAGLQLWREENGDPIEWIDACVSDIFGPTLPCEWLEFVSDGEAVRLRGTNATVVKSREDFPEFDWAEWYHTH